MNSVDNMVSIWQKKGIALLPPATSSEIESVFRSLDARISNDILTLYMTVGGFDTDDTDFLWRMWSLREIQENRNYSSSLGIVCFADWLIDSHLFGFKFKNENESSVYSTFSSGEPKIVAQNAFEFFASYSKNPDSVDVIDLD